MGLTLILPAGSPDTENDAEQYRTTKTTPAVYGFNPNFYLQNRQTQKMMPTSVTTMTTPTMGLTLILPAESPDTEDDAEQCHNNDHPDDEFNPNLTCRIARHRR
jgi:hypothetical protein